VKKVFALVSILSVMALPITAAVVAPVMTMNNASVTPDGKFSNPDYNPVLTSATGTGPDGFDFRQTEGSAAFKSSTTVTMEVGGGTRTIDSTYSFSSQQRERFLQTESGFRFDASTDIHAGLNSRATLSTYGNFFFIASDANNTKFEVRRAINFVVDQPMELLIHLSGLTSSTDFKGILNNFQLRGGEMRPLVDLIYQFTSATYNASETTVFSGGGSKLGVDYSLDGNADASGINLRMILNPTQSGTSPYVHLSWLLRNDLPAQIGPSAIDWNRQVSASAQIQETMVLTAIPEPSSIALLLFPSLACLAHRKRPATPSPHKKSAA
jgi:hypothetical protein